MQPCSSASLPLANNGAIARTSGGSSGSVPCPSLPGCCCNLMATDHVDLNDTVEGITTHGWLGSNPFLGGHPWVTLIRLHHFKTCGCGCSGEDRQRCLHASKPAG
ncbi:Os11g0604800 [Oryza sativa Japonica Group]|uniref:Os11g0604800 protein n=1 Tax=Oryza sativa subsp. japonica TaxID=39947 RepID=A0A0P0Y470_ORYSJ|nr:Os11g0604800 [Oryza sativa Japonica Group]